MKGKYVTKKKLSGVPKEFRKWSDWAIGDIVVGKFNGWHEDQYEHQCAMIIVEDVFFKNKKEGQALVGKCLVLNHCGMVNKALESGVAEGTLIQVEYQGTAMIEKGKYKGKEAHSVAVELVSLAGEEVEDELESDESEDNEDEEAPF